MQKPIYCIISEQRSGSLLLVDLLNSHPNVEALREVFIGERPVGGPISDFGVLRLFEYAKKDSVPCVAKIKYPFYLFNALNRRLSQSQQIEAAGFKVMNNQVFRNPALLLAIIFFRPRILHLVRTDDLALVISQQRLKEQRVAHAATALAKYPVTLEPQTLINKLKRLRIKKLLTRFILILLPTQVLTLEYNEIISSENQIWPEKTLDFLEVDYKKGVLKSKYVKQSNASNKENIENYSEVCSVLKGTPWERFL